ncbi:MAG TPA: hypothetical protein VFW77_02370 [Candidatus Saccharimonadales bacterium]|nr:hypothetical protein [Candidatus Saccharimonadales bacterium]
MKVKIAAITIVVLSSFFTVLAFPSVSMAASADKSFDTCAAAELGNKGTTCHQVTNCETNQTNAFNPSGNCLTALPKVYSSDQQVRNGLKVVFGIAAGVSLVSLTIAAFNYATVATDPEKISRAKQTIVLSLIGLIISISAEAIVLTVLSKL